MHASLHHPSTQPAGEVHDYGRILLGLIVVAFGTLFLLDNAGTLDAGDTIDHWWPVIIIAIGLFQLAERSRPLAGPLIITAAGTVLLLVTTDTLGDKGWQYVWPTAIIAAGLFIIARWRGTDAVHRANASDDSTIVASGIFGGPTVSSTSQAFRGGSLTAIFGGVTLDLRSARPVPEGAAISTTSAFGGVEILVPRGWRIAVKATPIFGGVDDKTVHDPPPPDDAPLLRVDALAIFGGVEIKHEK